MKTFNKKKGFTIVELVIVIAVIGVLTAVLVPTFVNLVNKANNASDESLVKNLNTQLRMKEQTEGKNKNLTDALVDAKEAGYLVENLTPRGGRDILWSQEKDEFVFNNEVVGETYKYWKIYEKAADIPAAQTYSIYAKGLEWSSVPTLTVGFDAGENEGIAELSYENTSGVAKKDVIIRTNSFSSNLLINASLDTVSHFGTVGKVTIDKIDMNCYNENGAASYVKISEGKIVAKDGGTIAVAFAANNDGTKVAITEDGGKVEQGYTVVQPVSDANAQREGGIELAYSIDGEHAASATDEEIAEAAAAIESTGELSVASETGVQPEGMNYTAVVNNVGYDTLPAAIEAAAGTPVSLLKDVVDSVSKGTVSYTTGSLNTKKVALFINKSLTIKGNNHSFNTTLDVAFAINTANVEVSLQNLAVSTTKMSALYVGENINNVKLSIVDCTLTATNNYGYTIKTCNGADNMTLSLEGSSLNGWAAINFRGSRSQIDIKNCDLSGENSAAEAASNNYSTLVLDGDTCNNFPHHDNPGVCGSDNTVAILNSKISASSSSANAQTWMAIQYGAMRNVVTVDGLSSITNPDKWTYTNESEAQTNSVKVAGVTLPGILDE